VKILAKKTIFVIIGIIIETFIIYFLGIQTVQIVYLKEYSLSFDYRLLFFDGGLIWFSTLTFIILYIAFTIIWNVFFSKSKRNKQFRKRWLSKKEKERYSTLATKREMKKDLTKIHFNKNSFILTPYDKFQLYLKPFKTVLYKKTKFKIFKPVKTYMIAGQEKLKRGGLPIICKKRSMYIDADDHHSIIVGTTGSGKDWSVLLPQLEITRMAEESLAITDIKGEVYEREAQKFKNDGYNVIVINYINPEYSDCWNPYELGATLFKEENQNYKKQIQEINKEKEQYVTYCELRNIIPDTKSFDERIEKVKADYSDAIELFTDTSIALVNEPNAKDPVWTDTAADMLTGFATLLAEEGEEGIVNSYNILDICNKDIPISIAPNKAVNLLNLYLDKHRPEDCDSKRKLSTYLTSEGKTRSSFKSTFKSKISRLTQTEKLMRMSSTTSFDMSKVGEEKTVIFIIIHDEKDTYYPLVSLFFGQLYQELMKTARKYKGGRLPVPTNIIMSEAGNMPAIKNISSMFTAGRSRGVRVTMTLQNLEQLNEIYGQNIAESIINNSMNLVYLLASGTSETIEKISEATGIKKQWNTSKGDYEEKRVITKDKLKKMKIGEVVFIRQRHNPFLTRLPAYDTYAFYDEDTYIEIHRVNELPELKTFDILEELAKQ